MRTLSVTLIAATLISSSIVYAEQTTKYIQLGLSRPITARSPVQMANPQERTKGLGKKYLYHKNNSQVSKQVEEKQAQRKGSVS